MESLLWALGTGAASLFALAVVVSCWEHQRGHWRQPWSATVICDAPAVPAPASLDIDLLSIEPPSPDRRQRDAALDAALDSMFNGPTQPVPLWMETRPIVQAGIAPAEGRLPQPQPQLH